MTPALFTAVFVTYLKSACRTTHRVGPLSEYLGIGTPIVTKITSDQIARAIRNLTAGTAPGPDGFQSEYLKITLKAHNLELGKDVIT